LRDVARSADDSGGDRVAYGSGYAEPHAENFEEATAGARGGCGADAGAGGDGRA
jgi:hypothetical protein